MLRDLNEAHLSARDGDAALASRMTTFDTAYGLMREAPEAFDIGREPQHDARSLRRDGRRPRLVRRPVPDRPPAGRAGRAGGRAVRRRLEHELGQPQQHRRPPGLSRNVDRPIAALVTDLKQRGLLDETLIVGCSEFGRTPWQDLTPRAAATTAAASPASWPAAA